MAKKTRDFIERIQQHERDWGNSTYAGRPNLSEIFASPVVIFWEHKDKAQFPHETVSLHDGLEEVERYFLRLLFTRQGLTGDRRVADIYNEHKRVIVRSIKIEFGESNE
ncbi:MAG: hypothetical protein EA396_10380 [Anaerolineaceae bacterium]|nr:MAG: hypothetical protein EA396_10380 [Anaerolineaceae bacterium]